MTTEFNNWRRPGFKNIDGYTDSSSNATTFIKNTALRFLQIAFSQKEDLRYSDDEQETDIKIADQFAYQLEATDVKPAIIAVRGPLNWSNIGMNMGLQEANRLDGSKKYTDLIVGSVGFSCLSRVGLEAEKIASDVFNLFKFFRPTLMKHGFFTIRSMSIGPEQLIESQGEEGLFMVSVLMTCQVQDRWLLEPKTAAQLKKLIIEGLTDNDDGVEMKVLEKEVSFDEDEEITEE